ncbi:sigma factor-like helix-turn-helix DNA-binding protein [Carnobacterium maltaromaticum]|uniref:sigma factor-like helix-turn-helix DNA-binding protein n=3 Tax=Carnobacterium maltaromaticum TaxID=2751 RepID=UPI0039AEDBCF
MWKDADRLVIEYKEGLKDLKLERELIKINDEHSDDLRLLGGMISDMEHAIEWLETAREPGTRRTISNRSRYQRTSLWGDIEHLSLMKYEADNNKVPLTESDIKMIDDVLETMPASERAVYVAIEGKGLTQTETAEYLGISTNAVKSYIKRARSKVKKQMEKGCQINLL